MNKVELLLPAGNIEKLEYAIKYGADAVYFGLLDFSLRSLRSGNIISADNINHAVNRAHELGAKAYVTVNIFAHNTDIKNLQENISIIADAKPDAVIFSDFGIYNILKKELPNTPLHVSTQANTLNFEAVKFWRDLGVSRAILARELSIQEIREITKNVPDIEIEAFVHGSMCVSYSGRCLLSDYMTKGNRKSNDGGCSQPCRWKYKLLEETRPGEYYEIEENNKGSYILSPKDMALAEYVPQLIDAGVHSLKIEGRTKSIYYVSMAARAYRQVVDAHYNKTAIDINNTLYELSLAGNRGFSSGFINGKPDDSHYSYTTNDSQAGSKFVGMFLEKNENGIKTLMKGKVLIGESVQLVTPYENIDLVLEGVLTEIGDPKDLANTNDLVTLKFDKEVENWQHGIIRKLGENYCG